MPVEVFYLETDDSGRYVVGLIAASDVDSVSGPQVRDTNMDGTSALVEVFADGALAFDISLADHGRWTCALAFQPAGTSPECERAE